MEIIQLGIAMAERKKLYAREIHAIKKTTQLPSDIPSCNLVEKNAKAEGSLSLPRKFAIPPTNNLPILQDFL